jgi:ArsR family transcriptional regulator
MEQERAVVLAEMLRALGHPVRLRIVALLCRGETHVGNIAISLAVPQPIVSQQLRILRMSKVVDVARENGLAVYRLAEPRLRDLLACMESCHRE